MRARLRHQQWRYLFQACWLVLFAGLLAAAAPVQAWVGVLGAALLSTLLVKRAACAFACPLFPVGELLWRSGARLTGRVFAAPFWLDLLLRSAKYLVLGWLVLALAADGLEAAWQALPGRSFAPGLALAAALVVLSLFFQLPWCRYLCPAGALLGLVSLVSPARIRRNPRHCTRCHRCSNRCPANLPVMLRTDVRSAECLACYRCVDGCPAPGALTMATAGSRAVPARLIGVLVSTLLLLGLLAAAAW